MADVSEQTYEKTFDVGSSARLTLRNVRGPIEISGWDRPQVHIVAAKKMGGEWGAHESFEDTAVEMQAEGNDVHVRTRTVQDGGIFGFIGVGRTPPRVFYTIQVPTTCEVSVRTVEGKIHISDIIGNVYTKTVNGEIALERVSGQVLTNAVDADVLGVEIAGTLATKAVSGDVKVSQSRLASFWAKSVSGDVELETTVDSTGVYEVGTVSGDLHMMVPAETRAHAYMSSASGSASCGLLCRVVRNERGKWDAEINGGGATISLKTVSGDLTITPTANVLPEKPETAPEPTPPARTDRDWPEMSILKAVEDGQLTVEQALAKLAELDKS
jgi:hypothetical protein